MGESTTVHRYNINKDLQLLAMVSSVNIACGFHAGDPETMDILCEAALKGGIAIGAHPGYADRENFGRSFIELSVQQVQDLVLTQCTTLLKVLKGRGAALHHVKPHGALYNAAAKDIEIARAICKAIAELGSNIKVYGLSGSVMRNAAHEFALEFVSEAFADRSYQADGSLTPRSQADALITEEDACMRQVLELVTNHRVMCTSGEWVPVETGTICLHADGEHAIKFAAAVRAVLFNHEIAISAPGFLHS